MDFGYPVQPKTVDSDKKMRSRQDSNLQPLDPRSNALPLSHATGARGSGHHPATSFASPRGAMEARRFPEPEVVGSIPTAGAFSIVRSLHPHARLGAQQWDIR